MKRIFSCKTAYVSQHVKLNFGSYKNGRLAITLVDPVTSELMMKVTSNVPDAELAKDEILIKNYSENEGVLEFLVENGLVLDTGKVLRSGHASLNIVKETDKLKLLAI